MKNPQYDPKVVFASEPQDLLTFRLAERFIAALEKLALSVEKAVEKM